MANHPLVRMGTVYIPVQDPLQSSKWYAAILGAELTYSDDDKAIMNMAGQSLFLMKAPAGESANFRDIHGQVRFSFTFEVDGLAKLKELHMELADKGISLGEIEDRGHAGRNFVFCDPDGNIFDVWSVLSPDFKG